MALTANQEAVLAYMREGASIKEAAQAAGLSEATPQKWRARSSDWRRAVRQLRAEQSDQAIAAAQSHATWAVDRMRILAEKATNERTQLQALTKILEVAGALGDTARDGSDTSEEAAKSAAEKLAQVYGLPTPETKPSEPS